MMLRPLSAAAAWTFAAALLAMPVPLAAQTTPTELKPITVEATLLAPTFGSYRLSPDGGRVLFTRTDRDDEDFSTTSHIYLHDVAEGRTFQLTNSERGESNPRWLPDGRVLFESNRGDGTAVWVISPDGGEAQRFVEDEDAPRGAFSPDHGRIAFTERTDRPDQEEWDRRVRRRDDGDYVEHTQRFSHIWVYDVATSERHQLTGGDYSQSGPTVPPSPSWP